MFKGWKMLIGLEIHAQLLTKSKLFSPDCAFFTEKENQHIHPVSLGLPGTLPVLNKKALEYAIQVGLSLHCQISLLSIFARKNYFYPDLPKGYQISQYEKPLCENGYVEFDYEGVRKKVGIERVHIEEDAGRFHHKSHASLVNFNRAGVPLVEIVSRPDMHSPGEAAEMVRCVRKILQYLKVCDGNLEEGSLRCDCNVSVQRESDSKAGVRAELKNINSFRFIEKAIEYEVKRQISILKEGGKLFPETRLYDSTKNKTFSMRKKESSSDYRYFPDPDLQPIILSQEQIKKCRQKIPELFLSKIDRFQKQYGLCFSDVYLITEKKPLADYFERMVQKASPKMSANWLINEVLAKLNEEKKTISNCPVSPYHLGDLVCMIEKKKISGKMAKQIFLEMWHSSSKGSPFEILQKKGLKKIEDKKVLVDMVRQVLDKFPEQISDYKKGKNKIFGFFVGEVMKISRGQADPQILSQILKERLNS